MNGLTASLTAAQQALSPVYALNIAAEPRSTGWLAGGDAWETVAAFPGGLAAWNAQSIATDAAAGSTGILRVFLSWKEGKLACQFVSAVGFGASGTWTTPSVVTISTFAPTAGIGAPKPAIVQEGGRWHLYYRLIDGNIYYRTSTTNGATWSAATTLYGGGDAIGDLFACHVAASDIHIVQFATTTDAWRPRGLSRLHHTGSWSLWTTHGAATGWLPAGMIVVDALTVRQLYAADVANPYAHYLGAITCTLNADGTLATRSGAFTILWLTEGEGPVRPACHAVGRGFGGWLHTCQEQSRTRAWRCAGAIDAQTLVVEEPIPLAAEPLPASPLERHTIPVTYGTETLLVGLAIVERSVTRDESVTGDGGDVIAYRFDVIANGPGTLDLIVRAETPLAAAQGGWALWLTRSCTKAADSGSVTLALRIVRVERRREWTRITAIDALGILAATPARRPFQFAPYAFAHARAVETIVGWAGLPISWETTLAGNAPLLQWTGGESGLRALDRLTERTTLILRSRCGAGAGVAGEAPTLALAAPPETTSYSYGAGAHPLIQHVNVDETRTARLAVAHGVAARNDPAAGEDWALAFATGTTAERSPIVRPLPHYRLDRTWEAGAQDAIVAAWQAREGRLLAAGWVEAQAHLALEPYDRIVVEGAPYHVIRVVERWQERRLVQRIELARA